MGGEARNTSVAGLSRMDGKEHKNLRGASNWGEIKKKFGYKQTKKNLEGGLNWPQIDQGGQILREFGKCV